MTDITQPEALRLADWCDANSSGIYRPAADAAAELRRLQAERDELLEVLKDAANALEDEGRHYAAGVARAVIAKATSHYLPDIIYRKVFPNRFEMLCVIVCHQSIVEYL